MTSDQFLLHLQSHAKSFAKAVATNEGDWIIKGFIDVYRRIYTISIDTKVISKVLELLLFPLFMDFARQQKLEIELSPQQNFYPDLTFIEKETGNKFAVDIKSTYRTDHDQVNGMTLGAFTGYFRNRNSNKNTLYPYGEYQGHFVLGVIYTKTDEATDERKQYKVDDLEKIPSVLKEFQFFVQPKYRIASDRPGSGNTKNIGSAVKIPTLINGEGSFSKLGEEVYDDYWMFYLTNDMAKALDIERPYTNLKTYLAYKQRGINMLQQHEAEISQFSDDEPGSNDEEE
ncbi:type II restriction endonuclease like [Gloeomargarita lithophora Alchichica-D10]|uniref:Type II restriction endonuclease like n=1 Tax=Gloeomargarita lithophora Alchichica-D10 TaxID=1188229 RepID=A0A1J0AAT7_9CYAN|nr:type II restriction endonuclease [Gloeomargarita lithophora]APB33046.1 type II restriction endonuclease like [Gloeomargarita lithophora Alchichica-D10]